ncbi:hypothetical protein ASF87_04145 [Microbacterium sp. Leaf161]|uniref:hypothetical protein n=1 Tax=Microbacterium sp. Leaf161 TaxID=1736281 RepID=UPI0006F9C235|nr:hypothetical protein [Microbacterium sp. Leaf161]KQR48124.1 hypothetical protein ASF87_04145 [Microbacterium sp. Leaf161]
MTQPTHISQINGFTRGALVNDLRPYPEEIRFVLNRVNGTSFWAWSLWRAPEGADLLDSIPFSEEYMQCAGTADALALEVRRIEDDGAPHQYAIGKPGGDCTGEPTEVIHFDDRRHSTTVYPHEVFTADEAAVVFYTYFLTDEVSQPYELRDLHLSWPKPESDAGVS